MAKEQHVRAIWDRMALWLLLLALSACVYSQDIVEVQTKQGIIFTVSEATWKPGRSFYSFKNIPYAQAPVGVLRFKDPMPAESWEVPRNGSIPHPVCPQLDFASFLQGRTVIIGDEDCLYLNVYTPKPVSGADLPVMVLIHGDGYFLGSANDFPPLPIMNKDVVLVTINYRLNILGFISTGDEVIPGNQGLKDMTMSFQWIQDNIREFGGDPSRVTLFGSGTGGISAHYHMMIPKNKGLFHRVILQSGTVLSPGYLNENPVGTAAEVAQKLMCPGMEAVTASDLDSQAFLACLMEIPAEKLVLISNAFYKWAILPLLFVPAVDGEYLPDHPAKLIKEGNYFKVDIIAGTTRDPGALNTRPLFGKKGQAEDLEDNFSLIGPLSCYYTGEKNPLYLASRAFYQYIGKISIIQETAEDLTMMYGDRRFFIPLDESASFHSRDATFGKNIYMFELQHRGLGTFGEGFQLNFGNHWISHSDDLQYLFNDISIYPPLQLPEDILVSDIMLALFANFAATGNPTPNQDLGFRWAPVNGTCLQYLGIKTSPSMMLNPRTQRLEFWKNMPTKQNMILYPERFTPDYLPVSSMLDPCSSMS